MEFSYKLSEAEYLSGWKLRTKQSSRSGIVKTILFWVFILVCLMVMFAVIQRNSHPSTEIEPQVVQPADCGHYGNKLLVNGAPLAAIVIFWVVLLTKFGPKSLWRRLYLKDPLMQGTFTVQITPTALAAKNTAEFSSQSGWNLYDSWREGNGVVMFALRTGGIFVLSLAGLSELEKTELRGILSAALPQK